MRIAQIVTLAASLSVFAGSAGAATPVARSASASKTLQATVGQKVTVPAGFTLHKTWLFGHAAEGGSPPVHSGGAAGTTYVLNKPGTYRMTSDAAQMRFGFQGKGFVGDKIVVKDALPGHIKIQ
jgi:hypothetical protein